MNDRVQRSWEDFLNPDVLRPCHIAASLFIAGFELLKESIVGRIRDFSCFGFDATGKIMDPQYQADVLSRNRSPIYASLGWLKDIGAIDNTDVAAFDRVKQCRNDLANRLLKHRALTLLIPTANPGG